ncbi:MAG TPA: HAMP domain-containing sensor histidine kinase [Gaiellaceae bacterium]|nr:HAMP domain-containing sensor histidine kinase [Gaiellaceae bacterium]
MSRRILLGYLGLVIVVLVALEVPLGIQNARTERRDLEAKVERDATALASVSQDALRSGGNRNLRALGAVAYGYDRATGGRVVIVNRRGIAVVDTRPRGSGAESFASRPEIAAALRGRVAVGTRHSATLARTLLYVAVPAAAAGRVAGAVRITYPTSAVDARVRRYWLVLGAIAAIALAGAAVVGFLLARFVSRPLARLEDAAAAVGRGDLGARAPEDLGPPEVRSLAAVFNETNAKLEQLLKSHEEFVADASHQLRTPLTAVRLRLENLERDVDPAGQRELDGAIGEVERLGVLVDGLLALSRAAAEAAPAEAVDVESAVRERVEAWSALAQERGLKLVTTMDEGAGRVRAAPERLRQVLDNLIENAFEVSSTGGSVTVAARTAPPWIELRVQDEGPGLDAEGRRRAFDRFWRGRTGEGSGLGLAIARRLVEADAGEIELVPSPNGGLEAVVRLRPA